MEHELNNSIDNLFLSFDKTPLASGATGQVHKAKLKDGREVVVKVRHPHAKKLVLLDLGLMRIFSYYVRTIFFSFY